MFGAIRKLGGAALSATRAINKIPGAGMLKAVPGLGTALTIAGGAASLSSMMGGGSKSGGMPALPSSFAGMPALPGMGAPAIVGKRGIFRNDANIPDAMKQFAISKGDLRTYFRSPVKGYVVIRDQNGDPVALPKQFARMFGWKPAKKPPLSVGDWQAIQRADRATKKVRRIMATVTRVDKAVSGGKVKIRQGGKKK